MDEREDDWTEEDIDEEFPAGDGTAETETIVTCPHCLEPNTVTLDPGSGSEQEYVQDCEVCCHPWLMYVKYDKQGRVEVEVYVSE